MTKFSNLEKNFGLSSEENLKLNSTSREAVVAMETRDHLSNGVSLKDQRSRGNKGYLFFFICVLFFGTYSTYAQQSKLKIAVIDLGYRGGLGCDEGDAMRLTSILTTELVNTRKYLVMERSKIEQVIKELRLQSAQNASARAAEIGKLLGVHKIVTGEYIDFGKVSLRLIDVESGSIEAAITMENGARNKRGYMIRISDEAFAKKLLDALLD